MARMSQIAWHDVGLSESRTVSSRLGGLEKGMARSVDGDSGAPRSSGEDLGKPTGHDVAM